MNLLKYILWGVLATALSACSQGLHAPEITDSLVHKIGEDTGRLFLNEANDAQISTTAQSCGSGTPCYQICHVENGVETTLLLSVDQVVEHLNHSVNDDYLGACDGAAQ